MMVAKIPERYLDLFGKRAFGVLTTLMPDGSPQATPVWVDYDGTCVLVNTARGRCKDVNMRARPRVALAIIDPDNPYRYLQVRGRVVEITEQGAAEHIDRLARKYRGIDHYDRSRDDRVIYKIEPERAVGQG
jgi:PPOX class probable F420-dependent enzyme